MSLFEELKKTFGDTSINNNGIDLDNNFIENFKSLRESIKPLDEKEKEEIYKKYLKKEIL